MSVDAIVRPYRPGDREAVYDVCVRTADAGQDASHRYRDPEILPTVFAGPYLYLDPDFAFVLDNGERAVGYVIGTPDTSRFIESWQRKWLPLVTERFPAPTRVPATPDEEIAALLYWPERMYLPELVDYPAHLHIDLLPDYQRRGHGRTLMRALTDALWQAGVPRVHLGMLTANTPARAFYDRLGFHQIPVEDPGPLTYLGRSTVPDAS